MKKTLLLAFILISFVSEAQIKHYSFKVTANYPWIKDITTSQNMVISLPWYMGTSGTNPEQQYYSTKATIRQSFNGHLGFDASGSLDYGVYKKFFLTTGLTVSYIRFKQTVTIETLGTSQTLAAVPVAGVITSSPFGTIIFRDISGNQIEQPATLPTQSDNIGETTTLYLQVPVLAGISLVKDRLLLRAGATFAYLLNASFYKTESSFDGTTIEIKEVKDHTRDGYSELLASVTLQATYLITKRIGIDFNANKYLSPVYSKNQSSSKSAKYNTLSLGISYSIGR